MTSSSACSVSTQFPRADAVFFLPKTCKRVKLFMLFRTLEGAVERHLRARTPMLLGLCTTCYNLPSIIICCVIGKFHMPPPLLENPGSAPGF